MANILTEVTPKLLAQGLMALREQAIMPRLVNRGYEVEAGMKGSTVDVPIPSAIAAIPVVPGPTPPATADVQPTSVQIPLDQWHESPFYMTDQDLMTAMRGTIPMQASEAIRSIANNVDSFLIGKFTNIGGHVGTIGQVPYQNTTGTGDHEGTNASTGARKILNNQLAPPNDRSFVLSSDAEANALNLPAFSYVSYSGSDAQATGNLGARLGLTHWYDQNINDVTQASTATGTITVDGAQTAGVKSLNVTGVTGVPTVGELFTIAGQTQQYTITDATGTGSVTWSIEPALKADLAGSEAITIVGAHTLHGLAFHRDCFALAMRPPLLQEAADSPGIISMAEADPVSGLALRLRISTEHYRTRYAFSVLYGAQVVRAELGCRLIG